MPGWGVDITLPLLPLPRRYISPVGAPLVGALILLNPHTPPHRYISPVDAPPVGALILLTRDHTIQKYNVPINNSKKHTKKPPVPH